MRKNKKRESIYIPNSEFAARCNFTFGYWEDIIKFRKEQEKLKFKNVKK